MLQWISVALIVAAALACALRRLWRRARRGRADCADCPLARECRNGRKEEPPACGHVARQQEQPGL